MYIFVHLQAVHAPLYIMDPFRTAILTEAIVAM